MKRTWLILIFLLSRLVLAAQVFDVDTLQYSGNIDNRINLVILSDGYQEHELPKFRDDAGAFAASFFAESPFAEYKSFFNVFIIKVPSKESGADHPGTATDVDEPAHPVEDVDNYFGSSFDQYGIHRLLVPQNSAAITNVLATNFPSYDEVLILVNTTHYGGSGGQYATASLHSSASEIAIHEIGHSFTGLKDEYFAGERYLAEAINMTQETDPAKVKWKNWMNHEGTGIYQHCCGGNSASWYRPHEYCKMRYLGRPFCPVCVEGTVERIHSLISVVDSRTPEGNVVMENLSPVKFELKLIKPVPGSLKIRWLLNGEKTESNKESIILSHINLKPGQNTLQAVVEDTTLLVRKDQHEEVHSVTVSWTIENKVSDNANLSALSIESLTLSPAFAYGITAYTAKAGQEVASVKVTARPENELATLSINEQAVAGGTASPAIALKEGKNSITVKVTAQNGSASKTYNIEVERASPPAKILPEVTFSNETKTYNPAGFNLSAASNSSGALSYEIAEELTSSYPGDVTLSGNGKVDVVKSGKVKLRAKVAEDEKFLAGSAEMDLTITKSTAKVAIAEADQVYDGKPKKVAVTTEPAGREVVVSYKGSSELPVGAGEYEVIAAVADDNYSGEAAATLTIKKATAKVNIAGLNHAYDGQPKGVTIATVPEGLETEVSYKGSSALPVAAGDYEVVAVVMNENYAGEGGAVMVISAPSADLAALSFEKVSLSPAFDPAATSYSIRVGYAVASVKILATTEDPLAVLTINGNRSTSGALSPGIALQKGKNTIEVAVTAQDGITTKTYIINAERESPPAKVQPIVTFSNESVTFGKAAFNLSATTNSSGVISYDIEEELTAAYPGDVTLSGPDNGTISMVKSGKVRIRVNVAEDDVYLGESAEMVLTIEKAPAVINVAALSQEYNGEPREVQVSTEPEGLATEVYYNGTTEVPAGAGVHEVQAKIVDDNFTGEVVATLTIHMPTAISQKEAAKEIKLYPNPTRNIARLELEDGIIANVRVMDISGRFIQQERVTGSYEVNLKNNAAGTYLIMVQPEGKAPVYLKLQKH